jgi:preprotein translocase subunit SecD
MTFEFNGDGAQISGEVTDRLARNQLPLAVFLDGQPITGDDDHIIAPSVQSRITNQGEITGLSVKEARNLSTLLNTGAFPIPLRVIQRQDVDATLGETAVRDSVIAGEVALLIIMAFMILYYRVPGVMASLALLCYTSFVLAIFKLLPVTLTLSGVAAFVLSLGMAVDANILIFERMKEELRIGRHLIAALEDGFRRAWSSIRDSNISTLITCAILYWFGNQFNESAIKGFAITLAIGVLVSLFSAITVTRTFMYLVIRIRPLARQLWLFVPDLPAEMRHAPGTGRLPAMAGGADIEPAGRRRFREER